MAYKAVRRWCSEVRGPRPGRPLAAEPSRAPAGRGGGGLPRRGAGLGAWDDRGGLCAFDAMLEGFGFAAEPLSRLAAIVRGADTGRFDLAPQAAGLLAVSLGISRAHRDDLAQLDAAMALYDALYRWCRDGADETHS